MRTSAAFLLPLLVSAKAFACEPRPEPIYRVAPANETAPRNTHVYVTFEHWDGNEALDYDPASVRIAPHGDKKSFVPATVTAPKTPPKWVPVDVEVVPKAPLPGGKRFDVYARKGKDLVRLSTFQTAPDEDKDPPQWNGVEARGYKPPADAGGGSCLSVRSGLKLEPKVVHDASPVLFRVKVGKVETLERPLPTDGTLDFAGPYPGLGYDYGEAFTKGGKVEVTVTPLDLAGNAGAAKTITVEVPKAGD